MTTSLAPRLLAAAALLVAGCCIGASAETVDGITAIYNFGDSISDTGNLMREGATGMMATTTRPPYGRSINRTTGRCSDGYLMIDFLAKDLGLPLLNPYLDKGADFTHGVNFAVAGATAVYGTALAERGITSPYTNSSLGVQLRWFKEFMNATTNSTQEIRERLASSLVMVGEIGGNDYNYALISNLPPPSGGDGPIYKFGHLTFNVAQAIALIPDVVQSIISTAKELLDMGAVRMVIPGNFPVGCMPSYLSVVNLPDPSVLFDGHGCLMALNLYAQLHNLRLQQAIADLRRSYPRATIAYADYYGAYLKMLGRAPALDFNVAALQKACCGAGGGPYNFDMVSMCGAPGTTVCTRPHRYVSWDGIHLTQHAYNAMADLLFHGGLASPAPIHFPPQRKSRP